MASQIDITICTEELCQRISVTLTEVREIVAHGIIEPANSDPDDWQFAPETATLAARAVRLHRDLQIDWPGVALVLELLDDLQHLKRENSRLLRRLQRFE